MTLLLTGCGFLCALGAAAGGDKTETNLLTIVDATGKEHKLKTWKFTAGTKPLSWLAPAPALDKDKKGDGKKVTTPAAAEALEFSEGKVAPLRRRVLSYLPVASIRSTDYDAKKETVAVRVATSDKEVDDEVLHGLTGYVGTNILAIEATADLGELGQATVKFQGGVQRGVQSIRFSAPKPIAALPAGRVASIKQASKNQPSYTVVDLQVLYLADGEIPLASPHLYFKETIKLDLAKVDKMAQVGTGGVNYDVTLKSGQQNPLILIENPKGPDGKGLMLLEGLVGRFAGGYRLFPMSTVGELEFDVKAPK
jgi:hypothetical protein